MAARLAPHCRVLVAERGRRFEPGDFPDTMAGIKAELQTGNNPLGLWGVRMGTGTGVAYANALGGGSVLNYGITTRPEACAFTSWPLSEHELSPWFDRASEVLAPTPNPLAGSHADKAFLDEVEPGRRFDFDNTIDWTRCTQCGECVPGCNQGAKLSLDRTYLAMAQQAGAEIRTQRRAKSITPLPTGGYRVALHHTATRGVEDVVFAKRVVLAAGVFGTLDILHHNRRHLPTSSQLGQQMSMNGDALAVLYDTTRRVDPHHGAPVSTSVRLRYHGDDGPRTVTVMSGRVPQAALRLAASGLAAIAGVSHQKQASRGRAMLRRMRDFARPGGDGALAHTFFYFIDAQDRALGTVRFREDRAVLDWPNYAEEPIIRFAIERLGQWADKVGGTLLENVAQLPGKRSLGIHPLGGCQMGADIDSGVTDTYGRVFKPGGGVYEGLRVVDGSVMPGALGVPPSFTIAAVAERAADNLVAEVLAARSGTGLPAAV